MYRPKQCFYALNFLKRIISMFNDYCTHFEFYEVEKKKV